MLSAIQSLAVSAPTLCHPLPSLTPLGVHQDTSSDVIGDRSYGEEGERQDDGCVYVMRLHRFSTTILYRPVGREYYSASFVEKPAAFSFEAG